jgi:uncharacterized membrane protein YuzA (DUF378 family)
MPVLDYHTPPTRSGHSIAGIASVILGVAAVGCFIHVLSMPVVVGRTPRGPITEPNLLSLLLGVVCAISGTIFGIIGMTQPTRQRTWAKVGLAVSAAALLALFVFGIA